MPEPQPTLVETIAQEIWQAYVVEAGRSLPEGMADMLAAAVLARLREVRTIRTVAELEALPVGAELHAANGPWLKGNTYTPGEPWWTVGSEIEQASTVVMLPALLTHHPDWAEL